jgi:hypothetical protein
MVTILPGIRHLSHLLQASLVLLVLHQDFRININRRQLLVVELSFQQGLRTSQA